MGAGIDVYPVCTDLAGEPGRWLQRIPAYLPDEQAGEYRRLYSRGDTEP